MRNWISSPTTIAWFIAFSLFWKIFGFSFIHAVSYLSLLLYLSHQDPFRMHQGCRNNVKARGPDFRERALLNWYILRNVCKTSGVELRLIMFSIYWMIGVWGGSPPGDCAILEARWLHFLRFLKQIRKRIALNFWQFAISPRQSFKLKGHLCPLAPPGKGQRGRLPLLPPPVPASLECIMLWTDDV
jgi:hypothetical protein